MPHVKLALYFAGPFFKFGNQGVLLGRVTNPVFVWNVESGLHSALRARLDDLVLEVLGFPPGDDAAQTEGVAAVGQDSEAAILRGWFLIHLVHADPTHHILTPLVGIRGRRPRISTPSHVPGVCGAALSCLLLAGRCLG